jgi:hypothetical protein
LPFQMPAMEQCHERHAWAISWKGREALRTRIASLFGPQVEDRGVPYRWRENVAQLGKMSRLYL